MWLPSRYVYWCSMSHLAVRDGRSRDGCTAIDESFGIPISTPVYSADGVKLGLVVEANPYAMVVEEGSCSTRVIRAE